MSMSTAIPSISVVTATRGRPEYLAQLVPNVLADRWVRHFVVAVDGEDPETMALLSSLKDRFDRLVFAQVAHGPIPHGGQLRALDHGLTLTDADVVLLLDDDVVPTPGLAAAHARVHANRSGLVVVGPMPVQLPEVRADVGSLLYARSYLRHIAAIEAGEHDVLERLWLGNVSIRRSDCLSVGLYSPDFTASYHDDQNLGLRLAEAGLVGRYAPDLVAAHQYRRCDSAFLRDARRHGAGMVHLHHVQERLGPFDPTIFTRDLPAPFAVVVRRIGSSPMALGVARALLRLAGLSGVLGWDGGRLRLAQLSRRIMSLRGATAGEPAEPPRAAEAEVAAPAPLDRPDARSRALKEAGQRHMAERVGS